MGNYKFKFSDMIPNAWFYKLKYSSRTKNKTSLQKQKKKNQPMTKSPTFSTSSSAAAPSSQLLHQRKSYHFTRDLPPTPDNTSASQLSDPPRKSSRNRRSINRNRISNRTTSPKLLVTSCVSSDSSCTDSADEHQNFPLGSCSSEGDDYVLPELDSREEDKPSDKIVTSCHFRVKCDIPITMTVNKDSKAKDFDSISEFELPPIITKTNKVQKNEEVCNMTRISRSPSKVKKFSVNYNSTGMRLRTNSPRIGSKRFQQVHHRKSVSSSSRDGGRWRSLSESFVVVKTSEDPLTDFKESMEEMIMENNIRTSKDLEDLLTCYLSLNSDKYHHMIIKVFKQIWFEITDIKF